MLAKNIFMEYQYLLQILVFICLIANSQGAAYQLKYGIFKAQTKNTNEYKKFCYGYYSKLSEIPIEEENIKYSDVNIDVLFDLCDAEPPPQNVQGKTIFANETANNCSLVQQALAAEVAGAIRTMFITDKWPHSVNASNSTFVDMGLLENSSYYSLLELSENDTIEVGVYSSRDEDDFTIKYNLILIWLMAVSNVIIGAFWSGKVRHRLYLNEQSDPGSVSERRPAMDPNSANKYAAIEESSLRLSPKVILILVLLMCVMLVGLWFLLSYLVYIIMFMFCMASFIAIYCCLEPLIMMIPCGTCRTPYFNIYLIRGVLEVRQILLSLFAVSLPIIWFIFRKNPYAWILQDLLGIAFSINIMRVIRLPNLMICTLLLSLLVLYDIFFVFITPFITSTGTSIMVDVAQGGDSNEELPMVLKVPYFFYPEFYDVCNVRNFSILGFGDILVPGLLISFVHSFDLKVGTPCRLYFLVNCIAYGVGLLLTFVALFLMQGAQPALFYLVPATILPTVIIAAARGELALMWTNKSLNEKTNSDAIGDYPPIVQPDMASSSEDSSPSESFPNDTDADKSPITAAPIQ